MEGITEAPVSPTTDATVDNNVHMSGSALRHDPIFKNLLAICIYLNANVMFFFWRLLKGILGEAEIL